MNFTQSNCARPSLSRRRRESHASCAVRMQVLQVPLLPLLPLLLLLLLLLDEDDEGEPLGAAAPRTRPSSSSSRARRLQLKNQPW